MAANPHLANQKEWCAGKTKVFMKEPLENILEQQRVQILGTAAIRIQKHWRGAIARFAYTQKHPASFNCKV